MVAKILFHYADAQLPVNHKRKIQSFIAEIFKKEKVALLRLDYIFCSDGYLLNINRNFLNHDFYTDIITFDLSVAKTGITGEVYISVERVKENAGLFNFQFEDEALRVIFHGALHLCGYKDKKKEDIALMRKKEETYMRFFKKYK